MTQHPRLWKWLRRAAVVAILVALAVPHAAAAYQYRAALRELNHYHPDEARRRLDECLAVWPKLGSARLMAARAAREAGDLEGADRHLFLAQSLNGESSDDIAFEWALLQASAGNVREVESYLQKQADTRPADAHLVWEALAEGYLRTYRTLDAMACLEHWLSGSPDNVRALELRGRTFIVGRGVKRGVEDYRRVLELDPTRDDTRIRLAKALLDLGGYPEAIIHLERLSQTRPDDPEIAARLARCFNMLDRKADARRLLEDLLVRDPDDALAHRTLGQFALSDGKPADAEVHLRAAAAALPNDYQAHWLLYESLRQQGKPEAAIQLKAAEQVRDRGERIGELQSRRLAEQPLEPALHVEMATLLMRSGQTELALNWLQSALLLDAKYRPAHAMLADHYTRTGRADLAEEHLRLAADE